jgi:hypothetical protein
MCSETAIKQSKLRKRCELVTAKISLTLTLSLLEYSSQKAAILQYIFLHFVQKSDFFVKLSPQKRINIKYLRRN